MIYARDIYEFLNALAPFSSQEKWDNSGFLVGNPNRQCSKIALCLDITAETVKLAEKAGADIIISHHPVIFDSKKSFMEGDPSYELAARGINAICAHTCLDKALGGVNEALSEKLSLLNVTVPGGEGSFLRTAELPNEMSAKELAEYIKEKLGCVSIRYNDAGKKIKTVALCSGAGSDFIEEASETAEAFITGDAGHHNFIDAAALGISLFAAGHFETENPIVPVLARLLKEKFPDLQIEILKQSSPIISL